MMTQNFADLLLVDLKKAHLPWSWESVQPVERCLMNQISNKSCLLMSSFQAINSNNLQQVFDCSNFIWQYFHLPAFVHNRTPNKLTTYFASRTLESLTSRTRRQVVVELRRAVLQGTILGFWLQSSCGEQKKSRDVLPIRPACRIS